MHIFKKALLPLMATAAIVGCSNDNQSIEDVIGNVGNVDTSVSSQAVVRFAPSSSVLPFPTDILFSGTADGSINIPDRANTGLSTAPAAAALADPQVALNTMDGFSTTASMVFSLGAVVDTTNIDNGTAVRLFKSDTETDGTPKEFSSALCAFANICTGFDSGTKTTFSLEANAKELIFGVDFVVSAAADGSGGMSVAVLPLKPLDPSSTYMVLVTRDMPLASDPTQSIRADLEYRIAQSTTPVFYLTRDLFTELGGAPGMAGIEAFLNATPGLPAPLFTGTAEALFTPGNPAALVANDSCVFVKGVADLFDASGALPVKINFNPATDCKATLNAIADPDTAFSFESLRIQTSAQEGALTAFTAANPNPAAMALVPVTSDNMALTFSFSTQNIGSALINAKTQVGATAPFIDIHNEFSEWGLVLTSGATANGLEVASPGADGDPLTPGDASANIFLGTLNNIAQFVDPDDKNGSFWKASTAAWAEPTVLGSTDARDDCLEAFPALSLNAGSENLGLCNGYTPAMVNATHDIPVIVSVPNAATIAGIPGCAAKAGTLPATPGTGLPILIYQHGITTHRGTIMAIADAMAKACVAVVAIDLPKHGILPANDPFGASTLASLYQTFQSADSVATTTDERLVQVASAAGCQGEEDAEVLPSGKFACPSADRFINLENLANARDTFRQGVVDLHSLYKVVSGYTAGGSNLAEYGVDLDGSNVHFLGTSLGAITGAPFVAQESGVKTVSLNVGSGGLAKVLDGSASFEPSIVDGLSAAGVVKPSSSYETFMIVTQTMVDSADAMNMTGQIGMAEDAATFWAGVTPSAGAARAVMVHEIVGQVGATDGDGRCNASLADNVDNSGCPDLTVPNNSFINSSLATAWGAVSGSGQTGLLPGQNPVTIPVALSGTDVLTQGTAFVAQANLMVPRAVALGAGAFPGLNLDEVGSVGLAGAPASGVVRFTAGEHGSLLNPNPGDLSAAAVATSPAFFTTAAMQTQIATFVGSDGAIIAGTATPMPFSADPATNAALGSVIK